MHPAVAEPVEIRRAYASVVATLSGADGTLGERELSDLRELCSDLGLDEDDVARVVAAARHPAHEAILQNLHTLRPTTLRFTVLTDLVVHAFADGRYSLDERKRVHGYALALGVAEEQLAELEQAVIDRNTERREPERAAAARHRRLPGWALLLPTLVAALVPVALLSAMLPEGEVNTLAWSDALARVGVGYGPAGGAVVVIALSAVTWWGSARILARVTHRELPPEA